jgi:hypothetical protein
MRSANVAAAVAAVATAALSGTALLGLAGCSTHSTVVVPAPTAASHSVTPAARLPAAAPAVTKTVTATASAPAAPATTAAPVAASSAPSSAPAADPNVTDPWAVVSAYYGDIESGDYAAAWALLDSGMTTGQTYQQFVDGFSCTGSQVLTETGESGDQVSFDLAATDNCTGAVQDFSGTDTVQGGLIVAADVSQS